MYILKQLSHLLFYDNSFLTNAFFISGEIVKQQVKTLSEGQKGLLAFALLVLKEPSVLILDEPTNHINFRHLPVITKALNAYQGAMIVVSHDHDFVRKLNIDYTIDLAFEAE